MNERAIFETALEIPDLAARQIYLDQACAGNSDLRARLEALLQSHATAGDFLATPAVEQISEQTVAIDGQNDSAKGFAEYEKTLSDPAKSSPSDDAIALNFLSPSDKTGSLGRLGHYEVQEVLGHGAFGIVLRAFDEKLHRMVAIKVMSPELAVTSAPRKRFLREARAAAAIRHENVVAVHAVEEQPIPYLVMEYIPGLTLDQVLNQHGPLDVADVLRLGREIASGLAAAHAQGLIHRDIKPANILLENGLSGRVKITDFGLARAADDASATQSGLIAGTPMFMSPEQATGGTIDQRSDLFSLGSVLYVMVSGRLPFRAASTLAVLKRVVDDTPRPITEIIAETPSWLCDIIAKLHAKSLVERFGSASEVAQVLGSCLADLQANRPVWLRSHFPVTTAEPVTSVGAHQPTIRRANSSSPTLLYRPHSASRRWSIAAALVLLPLAGLGVTEATGVTKLATTVIRLTTGSGTLVIEADDPNVKVTVDGEEVRIDGAGVEQVTLKPGKYRVAAIKDGKEITQKLVTITRGGKEIVRVMIDEKEAAAATVATQEKAGWQGWPTSAPRPAIAPFDAAQAKQHQAEWAAFLKVPVEWRNTLDMKFILIPPGEFTMGSSEADIRQDIEFAESRPEWRSVIEDVRKNTRSEGPQRRVIITQPFYMGVHEARQADYQWLFGKNPSAFARTGKSKDLVVGQDTLNFPVDSISWNDAAEFCQRISRNENFSPTTPSAHQDSTAGREVGYRLLTDAEWEYACRAGTTTRFSTGADSESVSKAGWIEANSASRPHVVGELAANPFGLYDMHGNVCEWVQDLWADEPARGNSSQVIIDPHGPQTGSKRVLRGSDWDDLPSSARCSRRGAFSPEFSDGLTGFRIAISVETVRQALHKKSAAAAAPWPDMSEPTALDEWLKGREELTVKQDGTAMFQTIQAALDAQKEGQVVRVLDQGPYRETLNWLRKSNCGLVTTVGTIILQEKWRILPDGSTIERGHHLGELENCRLSGFNLISKPLKEEQWQTMMMYMVPGLCIERCVICVADPQIAPSDRCLSIYPASRQGLDALVCVRDCVIGMRLEVQANAGDRFLAIRNWIQNKLNAGIFLVHYNELSPAFMLVRNNVTVTMKYGNAWWMRGQLNALHVRFQHNTVAGDLNYPLGVTEPVGPAVEIEDNLNLQANSTSAGFFENAIPTLPLAREKWVIARNYGISKLLSAENDLPLGDPKITQPIRMLSDDPLNRNYLRIARESISLQDKDPFPGALPPGPAPAEGDWFNSLQERWKKVQEAFQQLPTAAP